MEQINALHIASFNGNIGDNANHNGFRRKLNETLKCKINYTEIEMREFYQSWNIRDFNSSEFIELCNSHDLVIIGGGNFFELKWDYSYTGTTINMSEKTIKKINTPILFHGVGCDVAKGVNQSNIKKFEAFLDNTIKNENVFISVRNDGSMRTIEALYGDKYNSSIYKVPDGAFFIETTQSYFPERDPDLRAIGINIVTDMKEIRFNNDLDNNISYEVFIERFANEINHFLNKHMNYQIILFPHIYSDLIAINDLLDKIDDRFRRTRIVISACLTGMGAEKYIFGLYKQCDLILGMRFHSNVCSIAQNIPTIALSSYKKIEDLYDEIDLKDRVIKVNKSGFELELRTKIESSLNDLNSISRRYEKTNEKIKHQSTEFYDSIKTWIEKHLFSN